MMWCNGDWRLALALPAALLVAGISPASDGVSYNRQVRPILAENCFLCHGPDKGTRKADMRLDVRESALEKKAIVPGQAEASGIVKHIFSERPDQIMPPP